MAVLKNVWDRKKQDFVEMPPRAKAFFAAYEALCEKHGLCLSHEDSQGSFILNPINDDDIGWVAAAAMDGV